MAHKQRHPNYTHTFIDTCAFDPGGDEEACRRHLFNLWENGDLVLEIAHSVQKEIEHPNTPNDVKALARTLIYTIERNLTQEQLSRRNEIRVLIRGNAKEGRHENDADHIFELYDYGGGYFVTTDERLLSLNQELFDKYFVTTIKPCEFVKLL